MKPWTELSANGTPFACRLQETFAAFLEHTDDQIGRLVQFLKSIDRFDDTLFIVLSDNGASQEGGATGVLDEMKWFNGIRENVDEAVLRLDDIGGPDSHCNFPWGWAQAGNTPLKWYKQNTHGGGVRDPLVLHWPKHGRPGRDPRQFCHAIDITPTVLDLPGSSRRRPWPASPRCRCTAPAWRRRRRGRERSAARSRYFEMLGHRGVWKDGWKAVTRHDAWPAVRVRPLGALSPGRGLLGIRGPRRARAGAAQAADRALECGGRTSRRLPARRPQRHAAFAPRGGRACRPRARVSSTIRRSRTWSPTHARRARAAGRWPRKSSIRQDGDGALISRGSLNSGFVLYVKDGRVVFDYNHFHEHTLVASETRLAAGRHQITVKIEKAEKTARARDTADRRTSRWRSPNRKPAAHNLQHRHGPGPQPFADQLRLPIAVQVPGPDS